MHRIVKRGRKLTLGKKSKRYYNSSVKMTPSDVEKVTNEAADVANKENINLPCFAVNTRDNLIPPQAGPTSFKDKCIQTKRDMCHAGVQVGCTKKRNVGMQHPSFKRLPKDTPIISSLRHCGDETLNTLVRNLEDAKQLNAFSKLLYSLSNGTISMKNQAWLCILDVAKYTNCKSTTNMVYFHQSVEFWSVIYLLFGQSALNVFRGPGHFGEVMMDNVSRGQYNPLTAKINFAVPSLTTLSKVSTGYEKNVPPGFVHHSLDVAQQNSLNGKQYTLSFDAKKVAEGSRNEFDGDINLWGREGPPSLQKAKEKHDSLLKMADAIDGTLAQAEDLMYHKENLTTLFLNVSQVIRELRMRSRGQFFLEQRINKLKSNNPNKRSSYEYALSRVHMNSHKCENALKRSLALNHDLMKLMNLLNSPNGSFCPYKFVDINKQPNVVHLMPPEYTSLHMDLGHKDHSMFVKPGSELFLELMKEARVTGSTVGKALGLETLCAQKEHVNENVKRRPKGPISSAVECKEKYSQENKKHAIATLVASFMPALLPPCHYFLECGPIFMDCVEREKLIAVSPHGMIQCVGGENCETCVKDYQKIAVQVKCIFPSLDVPSDPCYELPSRNVPEVLADMAACETDKLWFVSYTTSSVSLLEVTFDNGLWERMFHLCQSLYGIEKVSVPVRLHPEAKILRQAVSRFCQTNVTFIGEVGSLQSSEPQLKRVPDDFSPYAENDPAPELEVDISFLEKESKTCSEEAKLIFRESRQVLRQPASEVCVFMLNDKDRVQDSEVPNCSPVAYGLKGQSMTNADLRFLVEKLRDELFARSINILVEIYDGQWQNMVMHDMNGFPLNLLQLGRLSWNKISKMKKEKILEDLQGACKVKQGDKDLLRCQRIASKAVMSNVEVERKGDGGVIIGSLGGALFPCGIVNYIMPVLRDEVWMRKGPEELNSDTKKKLVREIGLRSDEINLLSALNNDILHEVTETRIELNEESYDSLPDTEADDHLPDLVVQPSLLQRTLSSKHFDLLSTICKELIELDHDKWDGITAEAIYPDLLTSASEMMKTCRVKDVKVIADVLETFTGRKWYNYKEKKAINVNLLVSAFEGQELVNCSGEGEGVKKMKIHQPPKLSLLCSQLIMSSEYSTISLQASYAQAVHCINKAKWMFNCKIPLSLPVPMEDSHYLDMPIFCYPEYSHKRHQLEPRTLDSAHILNNIRSHLCKHGYDFCKKVHFQILATEKPNVISRAVVFDRIDSQNVFTSVRFFGEDVTAFFCANGWEDSAKFVSLIRNWYKACDQRGIPADSRVRALYELYSFLTNGVDFHQFPFQLSGSHFKGMPITTYEALLQNISTRIYLFSCAKGGTYNSRSVTTLSNESFFADLVRMDKEGNGYPKAFNIPKIMGRVVTLNYYKHKADKGYHLSATKKNVYPVHLLENTANRLQSESEFSHAGFYRDHLFDCHDISQRSRVRHSDISPGLAPMRRVSGVRQYYHTDESKILPETRAGLIVK